MSRAFVKEQDDAPELLHERPVSPHPNLVTARGLALIEAEIEALRRTLAQAQQEGDKAAIARASRDLRYWVQRRSSAQLIEPPGKPERAGFATRVTLVFADGRRLTLAIVGEDEAEPRTGRVAYVSPLARSVMGKSAGECAETPQGEADIVSVEPLDPEG